MIGNSSINKIGSREVFEHFNEPCFAVDDISRCSPCLLKLLGAFTIRQDKNAKIRRKTVAR